MTSKTLYLIITLGLGVTLRKIHLVSSAEPNGLTWLLNVLLALDVQIEQNFDSTMWEKDEENEFVLKEHHLSLFCYLPELHRSTSFKFSNDVIFSWSHKWAHEYSQHGFDQIFLFVRDPRDALFSQYRRISYPGDYANFLKVPHLPFLLNPIDSWRWFHKIWLSHPDISILRFEDFKGEPLKSTENLFLQLNLPYSQSQIVHAIESSSIENAKKAQDSYLKMNLNEKLTYRPIHSGKPQEWQLDGSRKLQNDEILGKCFTEMHQLGYVEKHFGTENEENRAVLHFSSGEAFTTMSYKRVFDFFNESEVPLDFNIIARLIKESFSVKDINLTSDLLAACLYRTGNQIGIRKLAIANTLRVMLFLVHVYLNFQNLWRKIKGFARYRFRVWYR